MTVPVEDRRIQYTANGINNVYVYPFKIFASTDVNVYLTPPGETPDPATDILPPSAYSVDGVGSATGGNITITTIPEADSLITIESDVQIQRQTDYSTGGEFTGISFNNALDLLTIICQQLDSLIRNRGVTYDVTEQLTSGDNRLPKLPIPSQIGNLPVWTKNSDGNLLAVELTEDEDVSALRSELANEESGTDGARIVGYNNVLMGGPQTVHTALNTLKDEIDEAVNGFTTSIAILDSTFGAGSIQNNSSDSSNDIDFLPQRWRSSDDTQFLVLNSTLTKRLDASWAAGNNEGGLFSGSKASGTTYHLFLIRKDSDGTIDAGFDTSISAANKPVGYSTFRRVASLFTDGSSNWIQVVQNGDEFRLKVPLNNVSVANPGTSAILATLSVPSGLNVNAIVTAALSVDNSSSQMLVTSPDLNDTAPSSTVFTIEAASTATQTSNIFGYFRTDTSRRIRYRLSSSAADTLVGIITNGWIDDRGRFN